MQNRVKARIEYDSYSDPHLKARGFFEKVTREDAGTHLYPALAWNGQGVYANITALLAPADIGKHQRILSFFSIQTNERFAVPQSFYGGRRICNEC